jgi:hypothetical protein
MNFQLIFFEFEGIQWGCKDVLTSKLHLATQLKIGHPSFIGT